MNKKLNTILFIIGATILNVVLIIVVWVGLMRVTQVIIGAELYDQIFKNIIVVFMLLALVTAQDGRSVAKANVALNQLMMAYSREDEFEADKLSVKYLKLAGYDPKGVLDSLLVLKNMRKKGTERAYSFYKSHPYLSERIAAARTEIQGYTDFESYINIPERKDTLNY